jgi:SAM-dependent methyltransferase
MSESAGNSETAGAGNRPEAGAGDFSAVWLTLREPADAAARDRGLVGVLRATAGDELVVRDLGCGTGSMGRWLAPQLGRPQHWVLMDRDPALLEHARERLPGGVTVETRQGDVTGLTGADLAGTDLVTCSALLDLLTVDEVEALANACAEAGTSALFTLSVTGEVALDPAEPLDDEIAAAFNEHQRREVGGRRLLGPDAADVAAAAFGKAGATVTVRPAPWRLSTSDGALATEWLRGWVGAAVEQRPDLRVDEYLSRRGANGFAAGVGHADLLARFV